MLPLLRRGSRVVALLGSVLVLSCSQSDMRFSSLPARLMVTNTNTIPQLNASLGNPGEFCTIEQRGQSFRFTNLSGFTEVNRTVMASYQSTYLGLSGFIVGTPAIPEPGEVTQQVVCYDLACPNCYDDFAITKSLRLHVGSLAYCASCQRSYDLSTQGIVAKGDAGKALIRYRVAYSPYTLQVSN